jgi:hypothetical protein
MNTDDDNNIEFVFGVDNPCEIPTTNSVLQSTNYLQNVMIRSPEACSNNFSVFAPMCLQMMGAAAAVFYYMDESGDEAESYTKRNQQRVYIRLDWKQYWYDSLNNPSFERDIRMKRGSFIKLVKLIRDDVSVNREMAKRRGGDVSPET